MHLAEFIVICIISQIFHENVLWVTALLTQGFTYLPQSLSAPREIKFASFNIQPWFLQGADSAGYSFREM